MKNSWSLLVGATLGAVAGYVVGVLTAPKAGEETIQDIQDSFNDFKKKTQESLETLSQEIQFLPQNVQDIENIFGEVNQDTSALFYSLEDLIKQKHSLVGQEDADDYWDSIENLGDEILDAMLQKLKDTKYNTKAVKENILDYAQDQLAL